MRYRVKEEKQQALKDGIKQSTLANLIGINLNYACNILNSNVDCPEFIAKAIISVKENISFNDEKILSFLNYYFTEERS